ncbi:putative hydroxymethylpyrimidine transport system ATP-binding protein [Paenibacillus castaneae]|uniref:ABC transporter ATP-binding protein n=1 Tax=Paenibacillus castaneae TaxID=474957 RepID=UPI000C9CB75C|nr:ABC transporter ATP-binding protein [Paenibacillus castaneae]NIK77250.1 putative hydroxymethylpyrimidine transport system ATP-binding protein [Paenibacillus castaneae]
MGPARFLSETGGSLFVTGGLPISAIISLQQINYSFAQGDKAPIITDLSLDVRAGEFVSIIGVSGSGKSTLFKLIAGLLEPQSGEIRLNGNPAPKRLGKVAYMPQKDLLLPWRTVLDNCLLPLELARGKRRGDKASIRDKLERFGLGGYADAYPDELSGGMKQRAAFLRTLASGQDLLLLDEPFGALDAMTKRGMQRWLLALWGELNKTVLFITHDLEEAILLSDRIYIMPGNPTQALQEWKVTLPRPRYYEMNYEPELIMLRQDLEQQLHAQTTF